MVLTFRNIGCIKANNAAAFCGFFLHFKMYLYAYLQHLGYSRKIKLNYSMGISKVHNLFNNTIMRFILTKTVSLTWDVSHCYLTHF